MTLSERLDQSIERVEQAHQLDPIGRGLRRGLRFVLRSDTVRDALSGRPMGHPLHPTLVLVSGGSLLSASALDLTGGAEMRPAARRLIGIGLLSAVPTALAGWADWLDTEDAESRAGMVHAASNTVALAAFATSWRSRGRGRRGLLSALVGTSALGVGGWLGGHLAFADGVGVDTTAFQAGPTDWQAVASANDVSDDLTQVTVDGVPLLLTRVDGQVVALADRCTHRGGPLTEGRREGDCVVCPWHSSVFSLRRGQVVKGPATRPQPTYEVRERAGQIELRRVEQRSLRRNPVGV